MRTLFGPENDGLHIPPTTPGAYEWWYFDALSDDGRYALVALVSLGAPMSPYYKDVVDGRNPLPKDWCGVFFTLHEKIRGRWRERAYTYNLYRNGDFADAPTSIQVGGSRLTTTTTGDGPDRRHTWTLTLDEPGLWFGRTKGRVTFTTPGPPLTHAPLGDDKDPHTWVCVAPICRSVAEIILSSGERIIFPAHGYHDHNFGQLPWNDVNEWYWGYNHFLRPTSVKESGYLHLVIYALITGRDSQTYALLFDEEGRLWPGSGRAEIVNGSGGRAKNRFGFRFHTDLEVEFGGLAAEFAAGYELMPGPFYERFLPAFNLWNLKTEIESNPGGPMEQQGTGIGEAFRPSRLCHPLWYWLMWTRIRWRG